MIRKYLQPEIKAIPKLFLVHPQNESLGEDRYIRRTFHHFIALSHYI
jgi:hypothetical protein